MRRAVRVHAGFRSAVAAGVAITIALALAGCAPAVPTKPQLTVAAAASLDGAFTALLAEFAAENPDVDVRPLIVDGSSTLAIQLREGAPFDVIATANEATMQSIADLVTAPKLFANNWLVLAVPAGNPLRIRSLVDLAERAEAEGLRFVVCAPQVPCGAASRTLLDPLEIPLVPVSEEQSVSAVLAKVRSGEADAGLVYVTDVYSADGGVAAVESSADTIVTQYPSVAFTDYPIAVVTESPNQDAARAFVDFVLSDRGTAVLHDFGFGEL